jgi:hypothetical protein
LAKRDDSNAWLPWLSHLVESQWLRFLELDRGSKETCFCLCRAPSLRERVVSTKMWVIKGFIFIGLKAFRYPAIIFSASDYSKVSVFLRRITIAPSTAQSRKQKSPSQHGNYRKHKEPLSARVR